MQQAQPAFAQTLHTNAPGAFNGRKKDPSIRHPGAWALNQTAPGHKKSGPTTATPKSPARLEVSHLSGPVSLAQTPPTVGRKGRVCHNEVATTWPQFLVNVKSTSIMRKKWLTNRGLRFEQLPTKRGCRSYISTKQDMSTNMEPGVSVSYVWTSFLEKGPFIWWPGGLRRPWVKIQIVPPVNIPVQPQT